MGSTPLLRYIHHLPRRTPGSTQHTDCRIGLGTPAVVARVGPVTELTVIARHAIIWEKADTAMAVCAGGAGRMLDRRADDAVVVFYAGRCRRGRE